MSSKILAAGPVVGGPATIPYRVVLRVFYNPSGMPHEFVVHNMQGPLRGILAGAAAWKFGGGCISTILIFVIVFWLLGYVRC